MDYLNAQDFEKLNLRIGKIKAVQPHPQLQDYILLIDLGPAEQDMQLVADLQKSYPMDELVGKQVLFLENFQPEVIGGIESQGLLLITHKEGKPVLLQPEQEVETGVRAYGIRDTELTHH
jgi:methionine--tRNA ligase beta chain